MGSRTKVEIRFDKVKGLVGDHMLFSPLLRYIHNISILFLNQIYIHHFIFPFYTLGTTLERLVSQDL